MSDLFDRNFEIAFHDPRSETRTNKPFDDMLVALSAFPPKEWMKIRTFKNAVSARSRVYQLSRQLKHVRFKSVGSDLFARAKPGWTP